MNQVIIDIPLACKNCNETDNVVRCRVCDKLVCPSHRSGLGSISDGYTCNDTCLLYGFGGVPAPVPQPLVLKQTNIFNDVKKTAFIIIAFMILASIVSYFVP